MNYYGKFRTSYFKSTDEDALRAWAENIGVQVDTGFSGKNVGLVMIENDDEGIPTSVWDEDSDDVTEVDFIGELAKFIDPEWLVEVQEVGSEGMRYLTAAAYLVGSEGIVSDISFYGFSAGAEDYAANVGKSLTSCQY